MTENKRFINIGNEIHLNGEWWCSAKGEICADVITTALNELYEENEQLKFDKQQFKEKVVGLIDEKLKNAEKFYEMTYEDGLMGQIEVLNELRRELSE